MKLIFSIIFISLPILLYIFVFYYLFLDRELFTKKEFEFIFGLNFILFMIFFGYCIVGSIIIHKDFNKLIETVKKQYLWNNYGEQMVQIQPFILFLSFIPLFQSSIGFLRFYIYNDKNYLIEGFVHIILFLLFIFMIYYFIGLKNKYINFEFTNMGKVKFADSKKYIENILNTNNVQYKKIGPKKGIFLKSDETYLINNNFELLIWSTNKENINKFLWPEKMRFTSIIIGKINKKNRQLVKNIQKEIDKLKKNNEQSLANLKGDGFGEQAERCGEGEGKRGWVKSEQN